MKNRQPTILVIVFLLLAMVADAGAGVTHSIQLTAVVAYSCSFTERTPGPLVSCTKGLRYQTIRSAPAGGAGASEGRDPTQAAETVLPATMIEPEPSGPAVITIFP